MITKFITLFELIKSLINNRVSCSRKIVATSDLTIVAGSSFTVAKYFIEGMTSNKQAVINITSFEEDRG